MRQSILNFYNNIRTRLGDFWWYTLMIFCAQRAADCMNVFVGLYLVPEYVSLQDLGAIMPLTTFATCLAMPISIFATTFRNEISNLAAAGQFGKLKTLLRGTFIATGVFLALAVVVSYFVLPAYLERMRLVKGSLGILIVILAFVTSVSPIFSNALQALKKFKATSVIGILGAPLRLAAMVLTMPLRPLSGYFVGQTATPTFSIIASIVALRKELSVKAEAYWSREVFRRVARFAFYITVSTTVVSFWQLVSSTILRQRLPEMDSAAYYMASRFSEISNFLSTTLIFTMFPFTADLAKQGKSTTPIVVKSSLAMVGFGSLLAIFFWLFGNQILSLLPNGAEYSSYYWSIPWMIGIAVLCSSASFHVGTEISAQRFGFLKWYVPINLGYPALMLAITGYGYFTDYLPPSIVEYLKAHNITTLPAMLAWLTVYELLRVICSAVELARRKASPTERPAPASGK